MKKVIVGAAVLLLLGTASGAAAECESPWVAWTIFTGGGRFPTGKPMEPRVWKAYATKEECDQEMKGKTIPEPGAATYFRCYPATVDPRPRSER